MNDNIKTFPETIAISLYDEFGNEYELIPPYEAVFQSDWCDADMHPGCIEYIRKDIAMERENLLMRCAYHRGYRDCNKNVMKPLSDLDSIYTQAGYSKMTLKHGE